MNLNKTAALIGAAGAILALMAAIYVWATRGQIVWSMIFAAFWTLDLSRRCYFEKECEQAPAS